MKDLPYEPYLSKITGNNGFIAALDQSGGSTPKALQLYGIAESEYSNEEEMFERYCELDSRFTDETHLRSWFRDQVLHPHETTHTMEEVNEILYENSMELIWSSIEGDEKLYEDLTRANYQIMNIGLDFLHFWQGEYNGT